MTGGNSERWQAEVDTRLARLELQADEAGLANPISKRHAVSFSDDEEEQSDLDTWVHDYFRTIFWRPVGGESRWCSQWRQHPEAIVRLDALWRSWKALRGDQALGMSTWLIQFLDPQLNALLSARGTFARCTTRRHEVVGGATDPHCVS